MSSSYLAELVSCAFSQHSDPTLSIWVSATEWTYSAKLCLQLTKWSLSLFWAVSSSNPAIPLHLAVLQHTQGSYSTELCLQSVQWSCLDLLDPSRRNWFHKSQLTSMVAISLWESYGSKSRQIWYLCDVYWLWRWLLLMGSKHLEYISKIGILDNNWTIISYWLKQRSSNTTELKQVF